MRFYFSLVVFVVVFANVNSPAFANCALEPGYFAQVQGTTVTVCTEDSWDDMRCPVESGMVRENAQTGEVVLLDDFCVETDFGYTIETPCYQDECVPQGTYHYGHVDAFECGGCGPPRNFIVVEVTQTDSDCVLSTDNAGPTTFNGNLSWDGAEDEFVHCPSDSDGIFQCAVTAPGRTSELGLFGFIFLIGLFTLRLTSKKH